MNGILLFDKPAGLSSNQALQRVKWLYNARKAGHTGSLDPLATGLLPICFGEATKVAGFLLDADKKYQIRCRLGQTTTTGDSEGALLQDLPVQVSAEQIDQALQQFLGESMQVPPMFSALKKDGVRLYELARQGKEVHREPRSIRISSVTLLCVGLPFVDFEVSCSKGTYVRVLVEDLGAKLGCGGHVTALRRLELGGFTDPKMMSLPQLEELAQEADPYKTLDSLLLPNDEALSHWPSVLLSPDISFYVCQGQAVLVPHLPRSGKVKLYNRESMQFLGMGEILDDGRVAPCRLFSA